LWMWTTAVGGPTTSERRGLVHVNIRVILIMNSAPACTYAIPCSLPNTPFRNLLKSNFGRASLQKKCTGNFCSGFGAPRMRQGAPRSLLSSGYKIGFVNKTPSPGGWAFLGLCC
jgi:hypothetical protein